MTREGDRMKVQAIDHSFPTNINDNIVERWEGITNKALYLMPDTTDDFFATMNTSGTKIFSEKLVKLLTGTRS